MVVHEEELRIYHLEGIGYMHYALWLVEENGLYRGEIRNLTEDRPVELQDGPGPPQYRMVTGSREAAYGWWEQVRQPKKSARRARG